MTEDDFRAELLAQLAEAESREAPYIDINSGQLHRKIGVYPRPGHRMPVCCRVMRAEKRSSDEILEKPPKGDGASLTIRYNLPR